MDKTVIITGGTTGIGKATALAFAKRNYNVVVTSRSHTNETEIVTAITATGAKATFYKVDITDEAAMEKMINDIVMQYGKIDVLINNAGIPGETSLLAEATTESFRELFEVNVLAVFYGMKYGIRSMLKTGGGAIVNLSSITGLHGLPYSSQYAASKHAVVGLTKSAAIDYATQGIRVNAVAPGAVKTEIQQKAIDSGLYSEQSIAELHPMKRMGNVEDIANAIVFLASDECTFLTGEILSVDGGYNAQ